MTEREPTMDEAWREAATALPLGMWLNLTGPMPSPYAPFMASINDGGQGAVLVPGGRAVGLGASPVAALTALNDILRVNGPA